MKYKSCHLLEHGIFFDNNKVSICCILPNKLSYKVPLIEDYYGEKIDWDELISKKKIYREMHKQGNILPTCEGCFNLEERDWSDEDYINCLYISHWSHCNCFCTYCYYEPRKDYYNNLKHYKILPVLQDMKEKGLVKPNGYVCFSGGEPTVLDEFSDILELLYTMEFKTIVVNSCGILYNEVLAKGIELGQVEFTVSLDCGDRELYKKIKRLDEYDTVVNNLKTYASKQGDKDLVHVKYIILPEINDTIENAEKWIQEAKNIGVKSIVLDVETKWFKANHNHIPKHINELIEYIQKRAAEMNLNITYYSHAHQILHEKKMA